jgi:NAD(P)-dependent dehydrogenase (short-subunit alcohol dehydrogenase family)
VTTGRPTRGPALRNLTERTGAQLSSPFSSVPEVRNNRTDSRTTSADLCTRHVGHWAECDQLVQRAIDEFGRLDILVNNAGIAPVPSSLMGVSEELFDKISSKASLRPGPTTVIYGAAKAGLNALTVASAHELASKGIRVNAIVCGPFHTESFDRSIPTPELVAQVKSGMALGRRR